MCVDDAITVILDFVNSQKKMLILTSKFKSVLLNYCVFEPSGTYLNAEILLHMHGMYSLI